ncbi:uncharacterized protein C20orf204 homolog [Macrotis lagotis]|uniref:uncharacterized protein C20orf204 homolog n=1 Tax=Macrotis lagotis TaxID=92651 RepID=UPI003D6855FE
MWFLPEDRRVLEWLRSVYFSPEDQKHLPTHSLPPPNLSNLPALINQGFYSKMFFPLQPNYSSTYPLAACALGLGTKQCVLKKPEVTHLDAKRRKPRSAQASGSILTTRQRDVGEGALGVDGRGARTGEMGRRGMGATLHGLGETVPAKPAFWVLLLALLGAALGRGGGRRDCSVPDVLRHYRAVIFEELQMVVRGPPAGADLSRGGSPFFGFMQKNLTGSEALRRPRRGRAGGASCRAEKEHRILMSIASMGRALRKAVAGSGPGAGRRRGALERAVWTVAMHTEAVTREHCGTLHQVRPRPSSPTLDGPFSPRSRGRRPSPCHCPHCQRSQKRLSQEWQERKRGPEMEPELNLEPALAPGRSRGRGQRRRLLGAVEHLAACWEKLFSLRSLASAAGSY